MRLSLEAVRLSASLVIGALLFPSVSAKVTTTTALTLATKSGTVSGLLTELPDCASTCYSDAFSATDCSSTDLSCYCAEEKDILDSMNTCLVKACNADDQLVAERTFKIECGNKPHNSSTRMRAVYWSLYFLTLVSFASRILARSGGFGGKLWWDDWFIVISFAVSTGVTAGAEIMVVFGLGQDIWMLNSLQVTIVMILFYVAEFAYVIMSALTKVSIVCLYLRIFPKQQFRRVCLVLLVIIALFCFVFTVTLLTYCQPFSYVWTRWDSRYQGTCINMTAQTFVCASMNIVLDVTIFLLPIPQLLKLETNWRAKAGVILVFMLGLFVTICSIARLRFLSSWASSPNPTYYYGDLALWSLIELYAGVICACLPGMASLFRRVKNQHSERKKSTNNSLGGSKGFTAMSGSNSGMRSFAAKEAAIMKTTSVSVSYGARHGDDQSDEMELVERNPFDVCPATESSAHAQMPPTYVSKY
ncbi:hypothetical protein VSDG_02140 [Cytospora chrysosperma]|uniref:CFEM domain-containing protein n=1 Tax=Cytospora chrysosperma TaxID=252740 RepID=A0A423WE79_CYTCH|nr:hypothetical protein VSDG_02140 [Valsa sordida]